MRYGRSRLVIVVLLLLSLMLLACVFTLTLRRPTMPTVTPPSPNGFDTLSQAGELTTSPPDLLAESKDASQFRAYLKSNAAALNMIELAIEQDSLVPLDRYQDLNAVLTTIRSWKQALRLLATDAQAAELEGDVAHAAEQYAKLFILGGKVRHGALAAQLLSASAFERLALVKLKELAPNLNDQQKQSALRLVKYADRQPLNLTTLVERENAFYVREHGTMKGMFMLWRTKGMPNPGLQQLSQIDADITRLVSDVTESLRSSND